MNKNIIVTILIAVVCLGAGFFGGMQYQKSQRSSNFAAFGGGQGRQGGGRFFISGGQNGNGFRPVVGQIISSDANSITVKMNDGSTKIVIVSSNTTINKSAPGTKSDLKTGETAAVVGSANSDGSVTAQNIQLNPEIRFRGEISGTPVPTQ